MSRSVSRSSGVEVTCSGSDIERGFQQGASLKSVIRAGIERVLKHPAFRREQPWWMPYRIFRWLSNWRAENLLSRPLRRDYPQMANRLQGLSAGASIDMGTAYLVNAFEPLLSFIKPDEVVVPAPGACSAVAVAPQRSGIGQAILAHNFEYDEAILPYITVRRSCPLFGLRALELTLAPLCGAAQGINESGLCIVNNYAYTKDQSFPSGTIGMLLSETLANCSYVDQAVRWMSSRRRWGGGLLMLADAYGDVASVEISTTGFAVRRLQPEQSVLFHTNSFLTDEMRALQIDQHAVFSAPDYPLRGRRVLQSAECRHSRLEMLLAKYDKVGLEELACVMGDHGPEGASGEDTVCVHGQTVSTIASTQYLPKQRLLRMSTGFACQARYREIAL